MSLRHWLVCCLNSGIKQASKLGLIILTSYVVGQKLDVMTLAMALAVGFVWGVIEWSYNNPIPDDAPIDLRTLPPQPPLSTTTKPLTDKIDK